MAQLVVEFSDGRQERFRLDRDELLLGREPSCDVCIPDPKVSRRHARILRGASGYILEDLGSINGYVLDGQTVHGRSPLRHGSRIGLGDAKLRFEDDAAPSAAAQAPDRSRAQGVARGFTLRVVEGELVGQSFTLGAAKAVVGRGSEADVVLDDPSISRRHATLAPDADGVEVRDLGSSNGTFVDGHQVQRVRLRPGQSVRFGSLLLRLDGPAARAEVPRQELSQSSHDAADRMRARLPELQANARASAGGVAAAAARAHDAIDRAAGASVGGAPTGARELSRPGSAAAAPKAQGGARASVSLSASAAALRRRASRALGAKSATMPWRRAGAALAVIAVLAAGVAGRHRLPRLTSSGHGRDDDDAWAGQLLGHGPSAEELAWRQRLEHRLAAAAAKLRAEAYAEAAELYGQALADEPIDPRALWGRRLSVARLGQREDLTGGRRELEVGHPFEAVVAASSGLGRGLAGAGPPLPDRSGKRAGSRDPDLLADDDALLKDASASPGSGGSAETGDGTDAPGGRATGTDAPGADRAVLPTSPAAARAAQAADAPLPEEPLLRQALEGLVDQGGLQVAQGCGERAQTACASESYAACLAQTACLAAFDPAGELGPALRALMAQAVGAEPVDTAAAAALAAAYPQPPLRRAMLSYAAGSYAAASKALRNADTPRSRALQADVAQVTDLIERGNKEEQAGQAAQALGTFEQAETVERRLLPREVPSAPRQELSRRAQRIYLRQGDEARARGAYGEARTSYQRAQALGSGYPPVARALGGLRARAQKLLLQAGSGALAAERKEGRADPCAPFREAMAACAEDDPVHQQAKEELAACTRRRGRAKKAPSTSTPTPGSSPAPAAMPMD